MGVERTQGGHAVMAESDPNLDMICHRENRRE